MPTFHFSNDSERAKLTNERALTIFNDPRAQTVIAAEYGVSQVAVSCIKLGKTWKHIHARNPL